MKKGMVLGCLGVIVLVVIVLVIAAVGSYNHLVTLSQGADSAWAQVQNQYQRRMDLVPNLVATVQGAANFEKSTLTAVTEARASVGQMKIDASHAPETAQELQQVQAAQGQLGAALSHLLVVSENYPDLKANRNFVDLQAQLEGTENRISTERDRFNVAVQDYDTAIHRLPAALFAGMFGFKDKPYFQADVAAQSAPSVHFDFNNSK